MSFEGVGQIVCMFFFPFWIEGGMWDVIVLIPGHWPSIYFAGPRSAVDRAPDS